MLRKHPEVAAFVVAVLVALVIRAVLQAAAPEVHWVAYTLIIVLPAAAADRLVASRLSKASQLSRGCRANDATSRAPTVDLTTIVSGTLTGRRSSAGR